MATTKPSSSIPTGETLNESNAEDTFISDETIKNLLNQLTPEEKLFASEIRALTLEGNLVRKDHITVRTFLMANGTTVLALVFSDLKDGFIIGLPAMINSQEEKIKIKMIASSAIVKLFKHTVAIEMMPEPRNFLYYLMSISPMTDRIPGYFNKERKAQVSLLIEALKTSLGISDIIDKDKDETSDGAKPTSPSFSTVKPTPVMINEEDTPASRSGRSIRYKH